MKKSLVACLFISSFVVSCDNNWGERATDFANHEAPTIINNLSKKDLQSKWNDYFLMETSYGTAQANLASNIIATIKEEDLVNIESDPLRLNQVLYRLDQKIKDIYSANEAIYKATAILDKIDKSCDDDKLLKIYIDNKTYLASSLQTSMPDLNFSYSFQWASSDDWTSTLVLNAVNAISTLWGKDEYDRSKQQLAEAQRYILNLTLDETQFKAYSKQYCLENKVYFKETIDILRSNTSTLGTNLNTIYLSVVKLRNALGPFFIKNMLDTDRGYQEFYTLELDNQFTQRVREIYTSATSIRTLSKKNIAAEDFVYIETKLELLNDFLNELYVAKNSILGIKNKGLIDSALNYVNSQRTRLLSLTDGRLK